ncbi:ribbon-helix-helix domain-containing protein [Limnoraphis robusta]|uniref:CopG family transcriptional regulator n=1 Tax=Limnoraphis robusta CS-951 TaxID=1637645 RepID=A0A0F5YEE0_9CYAN|nr:type II toxin-antitoxin system ParD family antitoxin [Limnoraphis robusta]KKD36580.1 CopG family transcriptional regulator [Limnoraphis robusta CS-951]
MQITLNEQQQKFIAAQLASGNFTHPDEVVNVAFRLLEKLQTEYQDWLTETRTKVEAAALELERGEGLDGEMFVSEILERFQQAKGVQPE